MPMMNMYSRLMKILIPAFEFENAFSERFAKWVDVAAIHERAQHAGQAGCKPITMLHHVAM